MIRAPWIGCDALKLSMIIVIVSDLTTQRCVIIASICSATFQQPAASSQQPAAASKPHKT
jgi:hypothetical protein